MRESWFPLWCPYKVKYAGDNFTKRAKKISVPISVDRSAGKCFHSNYLLLLFSFVFSNVSGVNKKYRCRDFNPNPTGNGSSHRMYRRVNLSNRSFRPFIYRRGQRLSLFSLLCDRGE